MKLAYDIMKIAAFSDGDTGGNPAGVVITDNLPDNQVMQSIAKDVGFSETVFAAAINESKTNWKVRYFSPETEVPFCGHATIALGAALAQKYGDGEYSLELSLAEISIAGKKDGDKFSAVLQSPPTQSSELNDDLLDKTLALFSYTKEDMDPRISPARICGGASHLLVPLKSRGLLAEMHYDLDAGRQLMREEDLVTIMFIVIENPNLFHVRNAFASGGVLEDPATGAAAAALGGYLRDINWPHGGAINIIQGEDMGSRSLLHAEIGNEIGSSIRVSGTARVM